eukprot:m.290331 g.290331  ORF g.290331 m.290331 type:complete len:59 (+) comp17804_c0_seq18:3162-3338(+)
MNGNIGKEQRTLWVWWSFDDLGGCCPFDKVVDLYQRDRDWPFFFNPWAPVQLDASLSE